MSKGKIERAGIKIESGVVKKERVVDVKHNEVISEKEHTERKYTIEKNYFSFTNKMLDVIPQLAKTEFRILFWIGREINYNRGFIVINKYVLKAISNDVSISISGLNGGLAKLCKLEVLAKPEPTAYYINPAYMWKGYTGSRHTATKEFINILEQIDEKKAKEEELVRQEAIYKYNK